MHRMERKGRRVIFTFNIDGEWRVLLRPRLGLHQLAEHYLNEYPLNKGRSVWEYAIGVVQGGRKGWAGNWHKWEVQTSFRVIDGAAERRSVVLNPLRFGRPLAISHVVYRPTDDGLKVTRTLRWLTDATIGLHYVAMLPLASRFISNEFGDERQVGRVGTSKALGMQASMTLQDDALISFPVRQGVSKLYAARSTNEAPEVVRKGDTHHTSVLYSVSRHRTEHNYRKPAIT